MLESINKYIIGAAVPVMLIGAGIYFGFFLGWFHLRFPRKLVRAMRGGAKGGAMPIKAMTLALAGTLGVGNIVGVSAAIVMGGAGAVFWMCFSAFIAMVLKYGEIVLAMLHRRGNANEGYHGSAMYYINDIFEKKGYKKIGSALGVIFALLCVLNSVTMGCMLQTEAVAGSVEGTFGVPRAVVGIFLGALTFIVIKNGKGRIMGVTDKLVPIMTVGYVVLSLAVIIKRREDIGEVFLQIIKEAFSKEAIGGGVLGFAFSSGIRYGVMRGLISNEAGSGTAPMAHSVSDSRYAAAQGALGILEVFVDTILLCTLTALVVLLDGGYSSVTDNNFIMVTVNSYASVLGGWSRGFMSIAVLCFGFATVICWANYGRECVEYLFAKKSKIFIYFFVVIYSACNLFGAAVRSDLAWQLADLAIGGMTVINIIVLFLGRREIKEETSAFYFNSSRLDIRGKK